MSECVVRMEMPKNCFECPFSVINDTADGAWCNVLMNQVYGYAAERDEDCPIICFLPEGHGRLVDGEKLKAKKYHSDITNENAVAVAEIDWAETIVPATERSEA